MNKQTQPNETHDSTQKIAADRINAAYERAEKAKVNFVAEAVACGQMMVECKGEPDMCNDCTRQVSPYNPNKPSSQKFDVWLGKNCPKISRRTAYYWMAAASRVMTVLLELHGADQPVWITLDGDRYYISSVLTMPEAVCTEAMTTFRETFIRFLADKTLTEATGAALFGADDDSRIVRAGNGKEDGGYNGENRKDWPLFMGRKLHDFSAHLSHWGKMDATQKIESSTLLRNMILGEETKLPGRKGSIIRPAYVGEGGKKTAVAWPEELCVAAMEALRERLRK